MDLVESLCVSRLPEDGPLESGGFNARENRLHHDIVDAWRNDRVRSDSLHLLQMFENGFLFINESPCLV